MKKKLSRHEQEIAYALHKREGIPQKKLAALYDVSPAAMSGYMKDMEHEAEKSAWYRALGDLSQELREHRELPPHADFEC